MKFAQYLSAMLLLSACSQSPAPVSNADSAPTAPPALRVALNAAQLKNAGLEIGKPQVRSLGSALKVNGYIDAPPQNLVSVSFPMGGYLKQTRLLPGMQVRRGEVLATLEDAQFITLQQDYLSTKARLEYLSADLARQETLQRDQAASEKALQAAKAEYQTQLIASKALAEKLRLIGINPEKLTAENLSRSVQLYSPIDGFVSTVKVNIGKYVTPTDVLFELVNPEDIHLNLKVFEKDLPSLRIGQKVIARANAAPEKSYSAHIILISRNVGEDRSVEVHCHLDKPAQELLPGMFMSAEIEAENRQSVTVPADAVLRYDNKHYVFIAAPDGAFEMVEIYPVGTENGFTALEGVEAEKLLERDVVLKNAYTLLMQLKNAAGE